ncbi:MAG TPA: response regulator transcription factor [Chloroflexia bacterium]|jgi:DNA-binding NarL/FixJ family response regulator
MITLLIVDDQPSVLDALREYFAVEPDIRIVGEAADGQIAVALARELQPDVVITDIRMPNLGGIEAIPGLLEGAPGSKVIVLSIYDDSAARALALAAGANAFVAKQDQAEFLLHVVRELTGWTNLP